MYKVIVLRGAGDPEIQNHVSKEIVITVKDLYERKITRNIIRGIRRIPLISQVSFGNWKKSIEEYDIVIVFASDVPSETFKYIKKICSNKRVIYYLYGRLMDQSSLAEANKMLKKIKKCGGEIWSYNLDDCNNYKINYNKSFYSDKMYNILRKGIQQEETYDVVFRGHNKGRGEEITRIANWLQKKGYKIFFWVVGMDENEFNRCKNNETLPYNQYLEIVKKSKAVLDLVTKENEGLTLRPVEALIASKKLITNYQKIKELDLYSASNVFVLNENNLEMIETFLKKLYEPLSEKIVESYNEKEWIKRFVQNK